MRPIQMLRCAFLLALAASPFAPRAAAEEATLTLTGTIGELDVSGTVGADLAVLAESGNIHTWTLTLHGVTHARDVFTNSKYALLTRSTIVHATSFEFRFEGPDAELLNENVAAQFVGGYLPNGAFLSVANSETQTTGGGRWGVWSFGLRSDGDVLRMFAGAGEEQSPFAADADGFPIVPAELLAEHLGLEDRRTGTYGALTSNWSGPLVQVSGDIGPPTEPALHVADAVATEADRGTTKLNFRVSLTNASDQAISVGYRTVAGTAQVKSDFTAVSGTLSFQAGETAKIVTVNVKADRASEPDETMTLELFGAVGAPIADGVAVGTIRNDD